MFGYLESIKERKKNVTQNDFILFDCIIKDNEKIKYN